MIGCTQTSGWDMHQKDTPAGMDNIRCSIQRQTTGWHSQNILMRKLIGFKIEKKNNNFFLHEKNDFCGRSFFMPLLKHRSLGAMTTSGNTAKVEHLEDRDNHGTIIHSNFKPFYSRMECYQPFHHFVKRAIRERFGQQNYHVHPRCFYSVLVRTTATQSCRWSLRINAVQGV